MGSCISSTLGIALRDLSIRQREQAAPEERLIPHIHHACTRRDRSFPPPHEIPDSPTASHHDSRRCPIGLTPTFFKSPVRVRQCCSTNGVIIKRLSIAIVISEISGTNLRRGEASRRLTRRIYTLNYLIINSLSLALLSGGMI